MTFDENLLLTDNTLHLQRISAGWCKVSNCEPYSISPLPHQFKALLHRACVAQSMTRYLIQNFGNPLPMREMTWYVLYSNGYRAIMRME